MRRRTFILRTTSIGATLAAAIAGFVVQGWVGALVFPFALAITAVGVLIGWFMIDLALTFQRQSATVNSIRAKISRLPTEQIERIASSPSHPEFAFAVTALARRGITAKPQVQSLLDMLVSTDPGVRGRGMAFLQAFYPEASQALVGASSADRPEVWRERVAAIKASANSASGQP